MAQLTKENIKKAKLQATNSNDDINLADYAEKVSIYAGNGSDTISTGSGKTTVYGQSGKNIYNISENNTDTTIFSGTGKVFINFTCRITSSNFEKVKNDLKISITENNVVTIKDYFKNRGEFYINGENLRNLNLDFIYQSSTKKINLTTGFTNDVIDTNSSANDVIKSLGGNDVIYTHGGNDNIQASDGDDTLYGGSGNDKLYGGTGINTYEFENNMFEGNDTIYIEQNSSSNIKINKNEIADVYKSKNDLILKNNFGEKITLANYFKYYNQVIIDGQEINFTINDITQNAFQINGKGTIKDTIFNDAITGSKGSDKIYSYLGNDNIIPLKGNDKIYSYNSSNLLLQEGDGKDTLYGVFNEVSIDADNVQLSDFKLQKVGQNLVINYTDKDAITLDNYYSGTTQINLIILNGSIVVNDFDSFVSSYENNYQIIHGNNKFYSMEENNKIILPNEFDLNNITNATKSGNNLVISGIWGSKDKLTIIDYFKYGYDIYFEKENGIAVGNLNQILLDFYKQLTPNQGDFSSYNYGLEVTGGFSNDYLTLTSYSDVVKLGHGHDSVYAGSSGDKIYGDSGNDLIYGESGNDTIDGGSENDAIYGGSGADSIKGGKGNDSIYGNDYADYIDAGDGDDYVYGGLGGDTIKAGKGNDTISDSDETQSKAYDYVYAGAGNDMIISQYGKAFIYGEAGDDNIQIESTSVTADGGSENDTISVLASNNIINGGAGNDQIIVSNGSNNVINAGSGNDYIELVSNGNNVDGGSGNDSYYIRRSNEIEDSSGNDLYQINFMNTNTHIKIEDEKGKDTIVFANKARNNLSISFDVELNSKNKVIDSGDIDVLIKTNTNSTVILDDYFGKGCIEKIQTEDGYYITKTQMQNVLQEVTAWLTSNGYGSTQMAYQQNGNSMPDELVAIFNDINWQQ